MRYKQPRLVQFYYTYREDGKTRSTLTNEVMCKQPRSTQAFKDLEAKAKECGWIKSYGWNMAESMVVSN
mgnify:CR=1 FL=1